MKPLRKLADGCCDEATKVRGTMMVAWCRGAAEKH